MRFDLVRQKPKQSLVHFGDGFVLHPVSTIRNSQFAIRRVDKSANPAHSLWQDGVIPLTINEECRHTNAAIVLGSLDSATEERLKDIRPIVIDSRRQSARLA